MSVKTYSLVWGVGFLKRDHIRTGEYFLTDIAFSSALTFIY